MNLQEALGRLPYLVALDAEQRAVVLAVRGTSSLSDALTDAIAQPCDLLAGWLGRAAQARSPHVTCRVPMQANMMAFCVQGRTGSKAPDGILQLQSWMDACACTGADGYNYSIIVIILSISTSHSASQ